MQRRARVLEGRDVRLDVRPVAQDLAQRLHVALLARDVHRGALGCIGSQAGRTGAQAGRDGYTGAAGPQCTSSRTRSSTTELSACSSAATQRASPVPADWWRGVSSSALRCESAGRVAGQARRRVMAASRASSAA